MTRTTDRRRFLVTAAAAGTLLAARPAWAITGGQAQGLVEQAVAEVNAIIASGGSEAQMLPRFARLFDRYADTAYVAAFALGADARSASNAQRAAFVDAFGTYLSRKYGRRFREFIGGRIEVRGTRPEGNYMVVQSTAVLRGQSPFQVDWQVSDRTGRPLFFNLVIEGVNMLLAERTEVGAMLDRRGGNIDALIADLRNV